MDNITVNYLTFTDGPTEAVTDYLPPGWLEYIYFSIHLIIFLASLIGNSLAVLSLISSASQFYVWFFNLVSADLLKTCICMPYTLYLIWNYKLYRKIAHQSLIGDPPFCREEGAIFMVCMLVSLLSNMSIAVDRVIAITAPMFYANLQKRIKPQILFLATWIFSITLAIAPALHVNTYVYKPFVPNCSLELHNHLHKYMDVYWTKIVVGILYSLLFGLPIAVVCTSCAVVTYKLYKKTIIPSEDGITKKNLEKKSRVMSNRGSMQSNGSDGESRLTRLSLDQTAEQSQISTIRSSSRTSSPALGNDSGINCTFQML
ncbi:orexin/Hypocretin receptor type 1-like isoform X2 [Bolinopsis microptera]|uniref:orexin/Hypocretin receptor type 1-like isoform X2 n=1 Tax=Bolinopsis microptera TaxID=2820187 RepID=UPI00307AFCEC